MKLTKKDECSYSISNAIRTLAMVSAAGCDLRRIVMIETNRYKQQRIAV